MAEREWARMEANDSQECRNCHTQESMELSEQSLLAVKNHTAAEKNGETCIQCHKGIAHKLPDMTGVPGWEQLPTGTALTQASEFRQGNTGACPHENNEQVIV